ncbi:two-component system sensor histidine kinase NtrB [Neptunomonas antarctica]|uniref:histidine kinase n=1 Tax=Neptunomonas antarctica TaxID=619304 RepID=A0A1N7LL57_9GAMM|nr:PAS domain-containing protein [Neptunomonas antarctica]SIS74575.1 PAS domain S-box-containing protein [Neptunomonas antarctica]
MKSILLVVLLSMQSFWVQAGIQSIFKDENGKTNWQILANWSSGTLIILLSIVAVSLYFARRRASKANLELTAIRKDLELRVKERTATLDESNRLLITSNQLLEEEVSQHVITSDRLRSSESYIRDILTSMPLMLVGLDKEGRVTQWNKQVEDVSGIPAAHALGKTLWEAYPTVSIAPEQIQQVIANQAPIHLKQSLRSTEHYDITIYPLKGQEDAGVVILVDDISKQTAAENMLIHNDKMSFMGELASTMAHDINVPLQAILMDLKSFQHTLTNKDYAQQPIASLDQASKLNTILHDMSDKGEQVSTIISNLLTFARSRHEKKQLADIVDIMENAISLANDVISVSPNLPFSKVILERHFEKNLPLVPCYITELQQVFLSLFRHACHALELKMGEAQTLTKGALASGNTTEGGFKPTIRIILAECYDSLWIKIQHNGIGLTNEEQMCLFEPFFSNKAPEADFDAGQRLSFSYYIVTEQHQGNMAVTSDVNVGSTVHIQLPIEH